MAASDPWYQALLSVAARWKDPDHPRRAEAAAATLAAENRFTEESLAFSVNHAADLVARGGLLQWCGREPAPVRAHVAVLTMGRTPLEGFFDSLAAAVLGHTVTSSVGSASPALLPAFFEEVNREADEERFHIAPLRRALADANAATGNGSSDDLRAWGDMAAGAGIGSDRVYFRPTGFGVAILNGSEERMELSGLAEDVLLHEGGTPQNVRLLFAPHDLEPDAVLEAMAGFRELHPAHPSTDGSLAMPAAFLGSAKAPHAVGPGFLVSKGVPEEQSGAHLRWTGYSDLGEVARWTEANRERISFLTTGSSIAGTLRQSDLPVIGFGDAHRPEPGQPPLIEEVPDFFRRLS